MHHLSSNNAWNSHHDIIRFLVIQRSDMDFETRSSKSSNPEKMGTGARDRIRDIQSSRQAPLPTRPHPALLRAILFICIIHTCKIIVFTIYCVIRYIYFYHFSSWHHILLIALYRTQRPNNPTGSSLDTWSDNTTRSIKDKI